MNELVQLLRVDANAANALGAIASELAAVLVLVVSVFSVMVSVRALRIQRPAQLPCWTAAPEQLHG